MEKNNTIQPLDILMTQYELTNALLVNVSTEQLSFKMVQKARRGRRISPNIQKKILTALQLVRPDLKIRRRDLFRYEMPASTIKNIKQAQTKVFAKKIDYPQYIELLVKAGVTGYYVDIVKNCVTFYGTGGEAYVEQRQGAPFEKLRSGLFDALRIKTAILDAQKGSIDYGTFLKQIFDAGIVAYDVNCRDRKIKYIGESENYKEKIGQTAEPEVKKMAHKPKKKIVRNKQKSLTRKARLAANKRFFTKKKRRR